MADEKDKDKQKYSYRPNIEYQDTYESDHLNKGYETVHVDDATDDTEDMYTINSITNTFNEISKIVPLLPAELQTNINNVYKPILDSWANLEKKPYPKKIPDPDKIHWKSPERDPDDDPWDIKYVYPVPPDIPPPTPGKDGGGGYTINNDGIWDIDVPLIIDTIITDPVDIIQKEFIKNIADLFKYYTNRLKDILYHYYLEKVNAAYGKKVDSKGNLISKTMREVLFVLDPITDSCTDVEEGFKHLFDASLAMSETAKLKLAFLGNACPVEQTLFHLKNFKTIYLLRLRYASTEAIDGSNKTDAMSNSILKAMKTSYDQKYDVAFVNLYKYLNSSLDILEDVVNTELAGLKARKTLIEKGGIKK